MILLLLLFLEVAVTVFDLRRIRTITEVGRSIFIITIRDSDEYETNEEAKNQDYTNSLLSLFSSALGTCICRQIWGLLSPTSERKSALFELLAAGKPW